MRKILVAAIAALGLFSATNSAFAICGPQDPFNRFDGCGPRQPYVGGGTPLSRGHVINGPRSVMPYAVGMPPGPLRPRVYYNPPVRAGYGGGYGVAQGARVQGGQVTQQHFTNVRVVQTVTHMEKNCTWHRENGGPKIYDDPSCPPN